MRVCDATQQTASLSYIENYFKSQFCCIWYYAECRCQWIKYIVGLLSWYTFNFFPWCYAGVELGLLKFPSATNVAKVKVYIQGEDEDKPMAYNPGNPNSDNAAVCSLKIVNKCLTTFLWMYFRVLWNTHMTRVPNISNWGVFA